MFEDLFKIDFINTLVNHFDKTKKEAEEIWEKEGASYLDNVYSFMTQDICEIMSEDK